MTRKCCKGCGHNRRYQQHSTSMKNTRELPGNGVLTMGGVKTVLGVNNTVGLGKGGGNIRRVLALCFTSEVVNHGCLP